jgi:hypothetical protein
MAANWANRRKIRVIRCHPGNLLTHVGILGPFGGAKPHLLRRGKETPLRVNPEQAQAFRLGSRRVDKI